MYILSLLLHSWFPPLRTFLLLPEKEPFVPLCVIQGSVFFFFSGNLPSLHTGGHQYVVSGWGREWKWLSAIIYSDIELAQGWSIQSSPGKKNSFQTFHEAMVAWHLYLNQSDVKEQSEECGTATGPREKTPHSPSSSLHLPFARSVCVLTVCTNLYLKNSKDLTSFIQEPLTHILL